MSDIIVIKLGGLAASDVNALGALAGEIADERAIQPVIVHGGGAAVSTWSRRLGTEPRFEDGIRMTSVEDMEIVEMVLGGSVNTQVVRTFCANNHKAVGLSLSDCAMVKGVAVSDSAANRTARPGAAQTEILRYLVVGGYTPVVCSVGTMEDGGPCNINADQAALAIARSLSAKQLVFLSDVPGVLVAESIQSDMDENDIAGALAGGHISGGMIPKVQSALHATAHGVGSVIIGRYTEQGDFKRLLAGASGTRIQAAQAKAGE
ncbi:MAG: acetylglutamate kinase [Spirochaetaceae bacterium]